MTVSMHIRDRDGVSRDRPMNCVPGEIRTSHSRSYVGHLGFGLTQGRNSALNLNRCCRESGLNNGAAAQVFQSGPCLCQRRRWHPGLGSNPSRPGRPTSG